MKLKTRLPILLSIVSLSLIVEGCGKKTNNAVVDTSDTAPANVSVLADNPNAKLSPILQRLRGRWVKEVPDPRDPNPVMMRLFAVSDNTLQGRFLFAGAYEDTGVAATLKQDGENYTLTLIDDELREHGYIPKERTFMGTFSAAEKTLELKNGGGEFLRFDLSDPKLYALKFSGEIYRCIMIPTPSGPSSNGGTTTGTTTSPGTFPLPLPVPVPSSGGGGSSGWGTGGTWGSSGSGRGSSDSWGDSWPSRVRHLQIEGIARLDQNPNAIPNPQPASNNIAPNVRPGTPTAKVSSCGMIPAWQEDWSRMSGAGVRE